MNGYHVFISLFLIHNKKVNILYLKEYNSSGVDAALMNEITNDKLKIIMLLLLCIGIVR